MKLTKFRIILINCLVITSLLFGGTAYAQDEELPDPGITPDSPFYFLDNWSKTIGLFFAFGPEAKVRKALEYAEERLAEAQVMATKNKSVKVEQAAGGYGEFMAIITEKMEEARRQGLSDNLSELVALATSEHLSVLDGVKDKVSEQAKEAIARAKEVSINGQKNALRILVRVKPEKAIKINLAAIEGRLNRASVKATENVTEEVEDALDDSDELLEFGEEISEIARELGIDTASIEELVALATSKQLSVLDGVKDRIPEEAREAVARVKEISIKRQKNALRILVRVKPERATEINLAAIEARLNRASVKATENVTEEVEDALDDFDELLEFGEEIAEIARGLGKDTTTVEELVALATSKHLEVLAGVYGKVPEQAKPAIERAMANSVRNHERLVEALKKKGALGEVPEEALIPEEVRERVKEKLSKLKSKDAERKISENDIEEEPEKAREAIQEATEELAKLQSRVEEKNAAIYSRYFARISNLLSEAKTAFTAGNYEEAKKLAEKAGEALEDIEDAIERSEEEEEKPEELQSENKTREKVTPGAQSRNP